METTVVGTGTGTECVTVSVSAVYMTVMMPSPSASPPLPSPPLGWSSSLGSRGTTEYLGSSLTVGVARIFPAGWGSAETAARLVERRMSRKVDECIFDDEAPSSRW